MMVEELIVSTEMIIYHLVKLTMLTLLQTKELLRLVASITTEILGETILKL